RNDGDDHQKLYQREGRALVLLGMLGSVAVCNHSHHALTAASSPSYLVRSRAFENPVVKRSEGETRRRSVASEDVNQPYCRIHRRRRCAMIQHEIEVGIAVAAACYFDLPGDINQERFQSQLGGISFGEVASGFEVEKRAVIDRLAFSHALL